MPNTGREACSQVRVSRNYAIFIERREGRGVLKRDSISRPSFAAAEPPSVSVRRVQHVRARLVNPLAP